MKRATILRWFFAGPLCLALPATAQDSSRTNANVALPAEAASVPFGVGERMEYDLKFRGFLPVGSASMEVTGIENVRGQQAWHTVFRISGGTFIYHVDDLYESWMDVRTLSSLRYWREQNAQHREKRFEIYPDRAQFFEDNETNAQPSLTEPLDEGSFLYFVRTLQLEVGREYSLNRYFRPDRNPVTLRVLRRDTVTVPAGRFPAIVVQPIIKTPGIFSEGGRAEVWLSDDSNRIMLQMKSQLTFGSLNIYLKSYRPSPTSPGKPARQP